MRFTLTLLLVIVAALLVATGTDTITAVDARRVGKNTKKNAKKRRQERKKTEEAEAAEAAKPKPNRPTKMKSGLKDWSKVDWDRVGEDWVEDTELTPQELENRGELDPETGRRVPPAPKEKTHIIFGKLKGGKEAWTLQGSEDVAVRVHSLLKTAAINVAPYATDPANLIFIVNDGWSTMVHLFELALSIDDMDYLEFDNKHYYHEDRPDEEKTTESGTWGTMDYLRMMSGEGGSSGMNLPPGMNMPGFGNSMTMDDLPEGINIPGMNQGNKKSKKNKQNKKNKKSKKKGKSKKNDDDDDDEAAERRFLKDLTERNAREKRDWDTYTQAERDKITARRAREKRAGELAAQHQARQSGHDDL